MMNFEACVATEGIFTLPTFPTNAGVTSVVEGLVYDATKMDASAGAKLLYDEMLAKATPSDATVESTRKKGKKRKLADLEPPQRLAQEMYKVLQKRTGLTEKDLWQ